MINVELKVADRDDRKILVGILAENGYSVEITITEIGYTVLATKR